MSVTEQNTAALAEANRIRLLRAHYQSELKRYGNADAQRMIADLLETMPDWADSIDVEDALGWAPRVGPGTIPWMKARASVRGRRRLREITPRQRQKLADLLRAGEKSWGRVRVS